MQKLVSHEKILEYAAKQLKNKLTKSLELWIFETSLDEYSQ